MELLLSVQGDFMPWCCVISLLVCRKDIICALSNLGFCHNYEIEYWAPVCSYCLLSSMPFWFLKNNRNLPCGVFTWSMMNGWMVGTGEWMDIVDNQWQMNCNCVQSIDIFIVLFPYGINLKPTVWTISINSCEKDRCCYQGQGGIAQLL